MLVRVALSKTARGDLQWISRSATTDNGHPSGGGLLTPFGGKAVGPGTAAGLHLGFACRRPASAISYEQQVHLGLPLYAGAGKNETIFAS